ncbi:hypothetical protein [Jiangella alba]|uniref:Carbohydrate binding domain-containing protein n=1 Tax=Jiangella alba TaxID=561176 RepID=A0A1H5PYW2_9ACTN|nr:hypothetical protein [Jiangella alba]SEF18844.1 hypothetical protein SAMN04488561_6915 [Jiangella alba]
MTWRRRGASVLAAGLMAGVPAVAVPAASAEAESNPLVNPSFEAPVGAGGEIEGWSVLWLPPAGTAEVTGDRASDGAQSLHFVDSDTRLGGAVASAAVPAVAGEEYRIRLDLYVTSGTMNSTVYYLDDAGERVGIDTYRWDSVLEAWSPQTWVTTVPEGATQAQVVMNSGSTATVDAYVDNVRFEPAPFRGTEESLGRPLTDLVSAGIGYTTDASGRAIGVVIAKGEPSVASVVDINTGELLHSQEMPKIGQAWTYVTAADRSIYIGSDFVGAIYRFDPDAMTFELLNEKPYGQTNLWGIGMTESGRIVWGSYPDGKLFSYNPADGSWHDHGTVNPGNKYARVIDIVGETAYVGLGATAAVLAKVDLTTDEVTILPNPPSETNQEFVDDIDIRGDLMFVRYRPSSILHVYDLTTGEWVDEIEQPVVGLNVSPEFETVRDGQTHREVMFPLVGGESLAYDLDTGATRPTCFDIGGSAVRNWSDVPMRIDGMSDQVLVTARGNNGEFFAFDPATDTCKKLPTQALGAATTMRTIGTGPAGDIYTGGAAFAHIDPDTGAATSLPLNGQIMDFHSHDGLLIYGTYTGAGIDVYDPSLPWEAGVNPRPRLRVGHQQDRPIAMTSMDDKVAIGTFPVPARLGGALAILDPDTMTMEVYDNLIENQSIYALQYRDGLLYGGSGITGGLGQEPTETEGKLFVFDPATEEVVFETVPVPGDGHVSGLVFDDEGYLWGVTANAIFKFDPDTREVVAQRRYFNTDDSRAYVRGRELYWHDDMLVGATSGRVFEVDPDTLDMEIIATNTANLAIDKDGRYYYGRSSELLRWTPAEPAPRCDVTVDEDRTAPLTADGTTVCVDGVTVGGPVSVSGGGSLHVTDATIAGPLRVTSAGTVDVTGSTLNGPVDIGGTSTRLRFTGNTVTGPVRLTGNAADEFSFTANEVTGPLTCTGNNTYLVGQTGSNTVAGPRDGQCRVGRE